MEGTRNRNLCQCATLKQKNLKNSGDVVISLNIASEKRLVMCA